MCGYNNNTDNNNDNNNNIESEQYTYNKLIHFNIFFYSK